MWRAAFAGVPDITQEIQEFVIAGSTIAARVIVTGTHSGEFVGIPATGKRFEIDQAGFVHARDGKAAEIREVADTASLLPQLGALGGTDNDSLQADARNVGTQNVVSTISVATCTAGSAWPVCSPSRVSATWSATVEADITAVSRLERPLWSAGR